MTFDGKAKNGRSGTDHSSLTEPLRNPVIEAAGTGLALMASATRFIPDRRAAMAGAAAFVRTRSGYTGRKDYSYTQLWGTYVESN